MRVMVINGSVVGKSTIARHLLAGPLGSVLVSIVGDFELDGHPDSQCLRVNSSGLDRVLLRLPKISNAVIDVSSEDHDTVISKLDSAPDYHDFIDRFIVPTVPRAAAQKMTIDTIMSLASQGVPVEKIRVVFNLVPPGASVQETFSTILDFHRNRPIFICTKNAVLHQNDAIAVLQKYGHKAHESARNAMAASLALAGAVAQNDKSKIDVMRQLVEHNDNLQRLDRELQSIRDEVLS